MALWHRIARCRSFILKGSDVNRFPSMLWIGWSYQFSLSLTLPLCYYFLSQPCHARHQVCHSQAGDKGNLRAFDGCHRRRQSPLNLAPSKLMAHSEGRKWIARETEGCVDSANARRTHMSHRAILTWAVLTRGTAGISGIALLTAAETQRLSCSFPKTPQLAKKVMITVTSAVRRDKCSQDAVWCHSDVFRQSIVGVRLKWLLNICSILCYMTP